jgi:hypothetical protein
MKSIFSNLLGFISAGQISIHLDAGAQLEAAADCISAKGAQRVRDALKGAIGIARLNTPDSRMQLLKVFDTIKVEKNDTRVTMAGQIDPDLVDPLLQLIDIRRY